MRNGRTPRGTRVGFLSVLVVCFAGGMAPGQGQDQAPPEALLRTTTRLVQISVIATDKKGEPLEDLTTADFVVRDNGHPQKIQIFRKETSQLPGKAPAALPPDTYTNQFQQTGSVAPSATMLLLDGLNTEITDQTFARQQVIKFLQQIQPSDRLAIYTLGRDLHVLQGLTSDSSKLVAALGKYSGQTTVDLAASTPTQVETGNDTTDAMLQDAFQRESNMYIQERVEVTVAALMEIANHAAALPGRKNLVWVSGSFPFSVEYENLQDIARMVNDPKAEANLSNEQLLFAEDIEKAARALTDANIAVYPVDARGLLGLNMNTAKGPNKTPDYGSMPGGQQNNGLTGGNPGGGGSHGGGRNGGGSGLPGGRPTRRGNTNAPTAQSPTRGAVTRAAVSPLESTVLGLAVRVQAASSDNGTAMTAMIFFDPRSIEFAYKDGRFAGTADVVLAQLDDHNEILGAAQQSYPLDLSTSQYEQFLKQQAELTQEIHVLPKATQLRVVLCDGKTGKVGTVSIPLAKYVAGSAATH